MKMKLIKAVVFIEGEPYRVTEFQDSEKLFEKHYESHWGLTKKECGWNLNRYGMFLCPLYDKRKYKSKKAILLVPKADYFGEQISTKKLLSIIKKELIQYEFEDIFEEIKNYINAEERDLKLNELGI
jgi:hypothetical protein